MTTLIRIRIETGLTDPAPEQDPDPVSLIRLCNIGILRVIKWRNGDGFGATPKQGLSWEIQHQLSGALRNDSVFGRIVEELRHRGFRHPVPQCRAKLKALKRKYKEIVDRSRRSGIETLKWTCSQPNSLLLCICSF